MESTDLKLRCLYCWKENSGYKPRCYSCRGRLIPISPARIVSLIASIAVVIAFAELPYDYYLLLRLFLCVGSLFLLFGARLLLEDWQRLDAGRLVLQQARDEESALGRAIYSKFTQPRVATFLELFKLRK